MTNIRRPGVYVSESLAAQQTAIPGSGGEAVPVFVGVTYSGPMTEPTLIDSWAQFVAIYGGFRSKPGTSAPTSLAYAVWQFFNGSGARCYVQRVLGATPVTASITIVDRDGTPVSTLKVDAKSPGAWGNDLRVTITDRDASNGRFDLTVALGSATATVERFTDLSMVEADDRHVEKIINGPLHGSSYIVVTDLDSTTDAPDDMPDEGTVTLASGTEGSAVGTSDYTPAFTALNQLYEALLINVPGVATAAVVNAAIAYAEGREDSMVIVDTAPNLTAAEAVTYASGSVTASPYAAVYWPWLTISDVASAAIGVTRSVPPGGAVLARYARVDSERGPFVTPAGTNSGRITSAVGVASKVSDADHDILNVAGVNAIKVVPGAGICIMGGRTLKKTAADVSISIRRSLIYVRKNIGEIANPAVFEPNTSELWTSVADRINRFLSDYLDRGGLRGQNAQEAFFITCDETNNIPATIAAGELHIDVGVALVYPSEFILINIAQWEGGSDTTEQLG